MHCTFIFAMCMLNMSAVLVFRWDHVKWSTQASPVLVEYNSGLPIIVLSCPYANCILFTTLYSI